MDGHLANTTSRLFSCGMHAHALILASRRTCSLFEYWSQTLKIDAEREDLEAIILYMGQVARAGVRVM